MECAFGITGKGFTLIASDTTAARSIVKMKGDQDKQKVLSPHLVLAVSGESGDTIQFAEFVEKNTKLYSIRNHIELRPQAAAAWTRKTIAESLRSRSPYQVNMLLGGYDTPTQTPKLFWLDYLGTLAEVPFAAHGYGAHFTMGTMDRWHSPDMNLEAAMDLLRKCISELRKRFLVDLGNWTVRIIDAEGAREIPLGEVVVPAHT